MEAFRHFINNEFVEPRAWLDVTEPATGVVYARVGAGDAGEIDAAVAAARRAFPAWSDLPAAERAKKLERLADLIDAHADRLATIESTDTGKPVTLARRLDIPRAAANLRYFAHAVQHAPGEMHLTDQPAVGSAVRAINYTLRRPRGVAGLISPWNLPLYLLTWKLGPALATGNTCVAKPSEVTPASATMLAELAREAGLPAGVLNIVHGTGSSAGAALVAHPDVPTISFTGSTAVGRWIGESCGRALKRVSLELGGKNPFLIFDDADLGEAVATAARAAFLNQGQICLCGSRLLVQRGVYERVREGLLAAAGALRPGDPADPTTAFGALTSREHFAKVAGMVDAARGLGGVVHAGGSPVDPSRLPARCRHGYFYEPTVIDGLAPDCRIEQEEIFGPVVTMQPFEDEAQALALANATPYGLAATFFTRDLSRAHRLAAGLDAGLVWVNCWLVRDLRTPFGGAKASGIGREGGTESLHFFTEPTNVCVQVLG